MLWFYLALATAALWGLSYVLSEKVLHAGISPAFFMLVANLISIPLYLGISLYLNDLKQSINVATQNQTLMTYLLLSGLFFVMANVMIFTSVQLKNASLASIIEITYPVFTIFFSWLLFKEFHLNWASILGTVLILSGVALVFYKG